MTNSATLASPNDFVSLLGGKNLAPGYVQESLVLSGRDDGVDVSMSGAYTGATLQVYGRRPDGTETTIGTIISPANNTTMTTPLNFAPGTFGDIRAKLIAIATGSILVSVNSSKSGTNAAPGAAAAQWPPLSPVGR